jgi:hypothetical protein
MYQKSRFQRFLGIVARIAGILLAAFGIATLALRFTPLTDLLSPQLQESRAPSPVTYLIVGAIVGFLLAILLGVLTRYVLAATRRLRLDRNDVYFVVGLALGVAGIVLGRYWH